VLLGIVPVLVLVEVEVVNLVLVPVPVPVSFPFPVVLGALRRSLRTLRWDRDDAWHDENHSSTQSVRR